MLSERTAFGVCYDQRSEVPAFCEMAKKQIPRAKIEHS
jgi:hypothetical protein